MADPEKNTIIHEHFYHNQEPTTKIKLDKGQKNTYGWEVTVEGMDVKSLITKLKEVDEELKKTFLSASESETKHG